MANVNTERDIANMSDWTPEQIHSAVGVALAEMGEQVNVIVSGLSRLTDMERDRIAGEALGEIKKRFEWMQGALAAAS